MSEEEQNPRIEVDFMEKRVVKGVIIFSRSDVAAPPDAAGKAHNNATFGKK